MKRNKPDYLKHIPQRTCVACRQVKEKQELIRLVRVSDTKIEIDTESKAVGRGAYLCLNRDCWLVGLESGRLEYALRANLTADEKEGFIKSMGSLGRGIN